MTADGTDLPQTLGELVELRGVTHRDRTFITAADSGTALSFHQYRTAVIAFAGEIAALGAARGDRIAIALGNGLNAAVAILGIIAAGGIAVPLNPRLAPDEIDWILGHSKSSLLVTDLQHADGLRLDDPWSRWHRLESIDENPYLVRQRGDAPANGRTAGKNVAGRDDAALILYTSGTTGQPKGVVLSHRNILSNAQYACETHRLDSSDSALCILPLFHINGFVFTLVSPLLSGGRVIMPPRFSTEDFWSWVRDYRATWFSGVPTVLSLLLSHEPPPRHEMATLRFARSASSSLPIAVLDEFEQRFGIPVIETYGITEAAGQVASNPLPPGRRKPGSVGRPVGNELILLDDAGKQVPAGTVGEVALRGTTVFTGYLSNREADKAAFSNGWFHTGDLGYLDDDGYLFLTGRKKEIINRAGEKISPREVEEVIHRLPEVEAAGVVGIPDPLYGEEVAAFITLRPGTALTGEQVKAFCRKHLAGFKVPRKLFFIPEIPKAPSGKIQRRRLIEVYRQISSHHEKETEHETFV